MVESEVPTHAKLLLRDGPIGLYQNYVTMTYLRPRSYSLEIGCIDLFGFIRIWPLRWTQKVLQAKGIVFPYQPLQEKVRLEFSIICVTWSLREYKKL